MTPFLPLVLWVLRGMLLVPAIWGEAPARVRADQDILAVAIATVALEFEPLYREDEDRHKTVALLTIMSFGESRWHIDAAGDCKGMKPGSPDCTLEKAGSIGAFQQDASAKTLIGPSRADFTRDAFAQVRVAMRGLLYSFHACPTFPIAPYAYGRDPKVACADEHSQQISNWRMGLARQLVARMAASETRS